MPSKTFSRELNDWLKSPRPKTLQGLVDHFDEKSFAILFLVLMAIPALPLPTGGVVHIFELIVMLIALEMIVGRKQVWLPKRWRDNKIPRVILRSTLPRAIKWLAKLERYTKPRLSRALNNAVSTRMTGLLILVFTIFAFVAPPFSGLDTLPALGVVLISLAIILEDFLLFVLGLIVGTIGISLVLAAGKLIVSLF